jgi:hypothetical protein
MPDSEATKARRPADWDAISRARREQAGWRCEACGVPNALVIRRHADNAWEPFDGELDVAGDWVSAATIASMSRREKARRFPGQRLYRAVLTVAHVANHDPADCRPENLAALCQPCHHRTHRKDAAA